MEFEQRNAAASYLAAHLSQAMPASVSTPQLVELTDLFEVEVTIPLRPGSFGAMIPGTRWVIRDDDLKLIDSLVDGAKAGVVSGFVVGAHTHAGTVGAIVGLACAVVKLVRQALAKGTVLTPLQYAVLAALQDPRGTAKEDLPTKVAFWAGADCDSAAVFRALDELRAVAARDGTSLNLVSQDAHGAWRAAGV